MLIHSLPFASPADAQANATPTDTTDPFALLPTETEIYILPGGEIIVADLPQELAAHLMHSQPAELAPASAPDAPSPSA